MQDVAGVAPRDSCHGFEPRGWHALDNNTRTRGGLQGQEGEG